MLNKSIPLTTASEMGTLPSLIRKHSGRRGLNRLLSAVGIPSAVLDDPNAMIPLEAMVQLFDAAARHVGEEDFGLLVGRGTGLDDFGDWAAYGVGARNLGKGLERICSTIWVHDTGGRMWLAHRPTHVVWHYTTRLSLSGFGRAYSDHLVKPMLDFVCAYLGEDWEPDWLELDYPQPGITETYEALISGPVAFNQPQLGIPVRRSDLGAASQVVDLLPRPVTSLDLQKYRLQRTADPLEQLVDLIDLSFSEGAPTLDRTARLLGIGARSLQRDLSRHGVQFRTLLEMARKRRAATLLRETDRQIKAIAGDLGYNEAQNFTRAFSAWYGTNPTAFRAIHDSG